MSPRQVTLEINPEVNRPDTLPVTLGRHLATKTRLPLPPRLVPPITTTMRPRRVRLQRRLNSAGGQLSMPKQVIGSSARRSARGAWAR
jgi:hypothetical protein